MAALADVVDEFKQASPGGKALMLVAIIAVAGVAFYAYKLHAANASNGASGTLVPIDGGSGFSGVGPGGSPGTGTTTGTGTGTGTKPINPPITGPTPTKPAPTGQFVTVTKFGTGSWSSTLWGIAQHFYGNGALWNRIAQANNITDPRKLQVGQRIFVPQ